MPRPGEGLFVAAKRGLPPAPSPSRPGPRRPCSPLVRPSGSAPRGPLRVSLGSLPAGRWVRPVHARPVVPGSPSRRSERMGEAPGAVAGPVRSRVPRVRAAARGGIRVCGRAHGLTGWESAQGAVPQADGVRSYASSGSPSTRALLAPLSSACGGGGRRRRQRRRGRQFGRAYGAGWGLSGNGPDRLRTPGA